MSWVGYSMIISIESNSNSSLVCGVGAVPISSRTYSSTVKKQKKKNIHTQH